MKGLGIILWGALLIFLFCGFEALIIWIIFVLVSALTIVYFQNKSNKNNRY